MVFDLICHWYICMYICIYSVVANFLFGPYETLESLSASKLNNKLSNFLQHLGVQNIYEKKTDSSAYANCSELFLLLITIQLIYGFFILKINSRFLLNVTE
jgi:hypothetical protein